MRQLNPKVLKEIKDRYKSHDATYALMKNWKYLIKI